MLNIISGMSGTGKTDYLMNIISMKIKENDDKILLLVPDQSMFDTEKTLVDLLGSRESTNVKAFGFSRLCDYIFDNCMGNTGYLLDDGTKSIIMKKAIIKVQDNLRYFKSSQSTDLVSLMLQTVGEFKNSNITVDTLNEIKKLTTDDTLKLKLNDTILIMAAYDALLSTTYIDPDDKLQKAYECLKENSIFKGYTILIDSFRSFVVQEQKILELLLIDSKEMYIAITTDNQDNDLFYVPNRTISVLKNICKNNNIACSKSIVMDSFIRFQSDDIEHLSRNIYSDNPDTYSDIPTNITINECKNIYSECEYVCAEIKKLIINENYSYNDIAIIYRNNENYTGKLDAMLRKYDIPYFSDNSESLTIKPLIKFINYLFLFITSYLDKEYLISMLKTGITQYDQEQISEFENYLLMWNLTGSKLRGEFTQNPSGFKDQDKITQEEVNSLAVFENMRKEFVEPILEFEKNAKDKSAQEITKLLYKLILDLQIDKKILSLSDEYESKNDSILSRELIRVWDIFIQSLDKMIIVYGDDNCTLKEYYEYFYLQLSVGDISFIPKGHDQVIVTSADRMRIKSKKAVFIVGIQNEEFPRIPESSGVFTDKERSFLISNDLQINDNLENQSKLEMFIVYNALSLPSNKLYLSYYISNIAGDEIYPSEVINLVHQIFPNITIHNDFESNIDNMLWSKKSAFDALSSNYNVNSKTTNTLLSYFQEDEEFSSKINTIERTKNSNSYKLSSEEISKVLFGKDLYLSASKIDKFHMCHFMYFCQYGLKAYERRTAEIDSMQFGTLMHYIFERTLSEHTITHDNYPSDNEISDFVSGYFSDFLNSTLGGADDKSERFMYLYKKYEENAVSLIKHFIRELTQSKFVPVDFELNIGEDIPRYEVKINDDTSIYINGFIDRVDIMTDGDKKFIRIIDYKTGEKKFDLYHILYGLDLQMLIYLSAITKNGANRYGENLVPAGILYQPSTDGTISTKENADEVEAQNMHDKALCTSGLILDNSIVITGMEKDLNKMFIPIEESKKTGGLKGPLISYDMLNLTFSKIDSIVSEMGKELHKGNISAIPVKGDYDACAWCPYKSVCGYIDGDLSQMVINDKNINIENELKEEGAYHG